MSFIETDRLFLRTWMPSDANEALGIYGDPEVTHFTPSGVQTHETMPALIARMMTVSESSQLGFWPVIEKSTAAIVGACGLLRAPGEDDVAIGWLLKRTAWGNGYASEAARGVLAYAFEQLRLRRIVAFIEPRNARSVAVAHRVGLVFDRLVRQEGADLMRYTVYKRAR